MARMGFDQKIARWMRRSNPGYLGGRSESVGPPLFPQAALETFKIPQSSGAPYFTYAVAPVDASTPDKNNAHVRLTGTSDQDALNILSQSLFDNSATGGHIRIMEGTVHVDGQIEMWSGVTFSGVGTSTLVQVENNYGNAVFITYDSDPGSRPSDVHLRDLVISLNGSTGDPIGFVLAGSSCTASGVWVFGGGRGQGAQLDSAAAGVGLNQRIERCRFINLLDQGAAMLDVENCEIVDCVIDGIGSGPGIFVGDAVDSLVSRNRLTTLGRHGIELNGTATRVEIDSNRVLGAGNETDNTYAGIMADDTNFTLTDCQITRNRVRLQGGNQAKYGIRLRGVNVKDFYVADNDLWNASKAGLDADDYLNAGLGTDTGQQRLTSGIV